MSPGPSEPSESASLSASSPACPAAPAVTRPRNFRSDLSLRKSASVGLTSILQVSECRIGFMRLECHGHQSSLDTFTDDFGFRKALLGPEPFRSIPETNRPEK